jgi:hypothetical protein
MGDVVVETWPPPPTPTPVFAEPGFVVVSGVLPDLTQLGPSEPVEEAAAEQDVVTAPDGVPEQQEVHVGGPVYPPLPKTLPADVPGVTNPPMLGAASQLVREATQVLTLQRMVLYVALTYVVLRACRSVRRHASRKSLKKLRARLKQHVTSAQKASFCGNPPELDP